MVDDMQKKKNNKKILSIGKEYDEVIEQFHE